MHWDRATFSLDPDVERDVEVALRYDVPVLITGRDPYERRRLAQYIHDHSGRTGTFVTLRSVSDWEIHPSQLRHATVFIDDVGTLDQREEGALMHLLEHHAAVGAASCRIIAASDGRLYHSMIRGAFRADLYYWLAIIHIVIPE
jgi:DNA-binding NtrC family response regulator